MLGNVCEIRRVKLVNIFEYNNIKTRWVVCTTIFETRRVRLVNMFTNETIKIPIDKPHCLKPLKDLSFIKGRRMFLSVSGTEGKRSRTCLRVKETRLKWANLQPLCLQDNG